MRPTRIFFGVFVIPVMFLLMAGMYTFRAQNPSIDLPSQEPEVLSLPLPNLRITSTNNQSADKAKGSGLELDTLILGSMGLGDAQSIADPQANPTSIPAAANPPSLIPTPDPSLPADFAPAPESKITTCAEIWEVDEIPFDLPEVLNVTPSIDHLKTEYNYYYLAAMLIHNKAVNTSHCPFNGIQTFALANQCGVEAARPLILEWQNQYDSKIFETSVKHAIPARLVKRLIALESQFWPGIYIDILESGFGQLNETGADALLMYSPSFFRQFCPLVLHSTTCDLGYLGVGSVGQGLLRGALVQQVNASCESCPMGINTNRALNSIPILAELMKANCHQASQIVRNVTDKKPGLAADYVDLWKITMANYNAGPGCTYKAVNAAWQNEEQLTWDIVLKYFTNPECQSAPFYVSDIFK